MEGSCGKKTEKKLKCLRTDNGLEFLNHQFIQMCKREGIERHLTVSGTPQQNGLAERMKRTLLERVRCLLSNANLDKRFWGEAVMTAAYLINRCPSSAIDFKTPIEKWTGKAPDLSNLRLFGCVAYAHQRQEKLDNRAKKCIFLGYPHGVKGYRLWSLEKGKERCFISRDVVFDEATIAMKVEKQITTTEQKENQLVEVELESSPAEVSPEYDPLETLDEGGVNDVAEEENHQSDETIAEHNTQGEKLGSTSQQADLQDYQLARDSQRRQIKQPSRYASVDLVYYALNAELNQLDNEPLTYKEAINSPDSI